MNKDKRGASRNLDKKRKLRVFISMPFTGKKFEELVKEREDLTKLVNSFGFELLEQFINYQKKDDFETKDYDPSYILAKDKHYIKKADVIIADFTSLSIGTACEVTIAKELFSKKVYAVVPEDKRKHSWLKFYCDLFFSSVRDALEQIKKDFKDNAFYLQISKSQYDPIAIEYRLVENTPVQKSVYDYEVTDFIDKNGKNKTVIVLHAASGYRARLAKQHGAGKVIGIDLSHKQIQIAQEEEMLHQQGIVYHVLDPYSQDFITTVPLELIGQADIVLGFFLLDHAMNKESLEQVTKNVSQLLKKGGTFFGMIDNPEITSASDSKYGVVIRPEEDASGNREVSPRRISIYQHDLEVLHFHNFAWKAQTIKSILEKCSFSKITFTNARVSPEGRKKWGKEFWESYVKNPTQIVFSAQK